MDNMDNMDNVLSDGMSSTDTEDDTYSGDSGDSDDDKPQKRKKSSISIPSIPSISTTAGASASDHSDDDEKEINNNNNNNNNKPSGFGGKKTFKIISTSQANNNKKKPFIPSLNTAMSKSSTIYDRNTNIKPKKPTLPGLTRPSSAKFGSEPVRKRDNGQQRSSSLRPSSARASGGDKKMSFILDSEDESEDEVLTPRSPHTPTSIDSLDDDDTDDEIESDSDDDSGTDSDDDDDDYYDDINIGLVAVTARDINTFRENVNNGYMPKSTAITYDGLLNEYHFDIKTNERKFEEYDDEKEALLFYPSYSYGRVNRMKILQNLPYPTAYNEDSDESEYDETEDDDDDDDEDDDDDDDNKQNESKNIRHLEHYLTVDLNYNINNKKLERNKLNLVILLDQSGSMGASFNNEMIGKSKMMIANECICGLIDKLNDDDRFALISFDDNIYIHSESKLDFLCNINKTELKEKILNIKQNGGTNFELAYEKSNDFFNDLFNSSKQFKVLNEGYDNRVIMLTDACPNVAATDPHSLLHLFRKNCDFIVNEYKPIYTTFIGVGLDFNTDLISEINKHRGCNYYSIKSSDEFKLILNDEFDNMVTPLIFNVSLILKSENDGSCIADIYGINQKERKRIKQSGEIQRIGTLFASKISKQTGYIKGGVVIIKLKKRKGIKDNNNDKYNLKMEIKYEDRDGKIYEKDQCIQLKISDNNSYFDNIGIRKGILLCRYCTLLKQWLDEDIDSNHIRTFLNVSEKWKNIFSDFIIYFKQEMQIINDNNLQKEIDLLTKLVSYRQQITKHKTNSSRFSFNTGQNQISSLKSITSTSMSPTTSATSSSASSPQTQQTDITDLIISFLELKDPRITWKMIEFLSNEPTTSLFMSFVSRMSQEEKQWIYNMDNDINYDSSILEIEELHCDDSNEIRLTQLSYSLMRILSNESYTETVKSFLLRKCNTICLHSLAVFHPLSSGNPYHGRIILECLLNSNPRELFQSLTISMSSPIIKLLKCALFRNIHRGNMNSFFLDLICFQSQSRQKLYKQQTDLHKKKLLSILSEWNIIPYILQQCHSYNNTDNISTKFSTFFIDLTARCASIQECCILFKKEYSILIVDELIGKGLLDIDNKRSIWARIQCAQCLIQFLDICSRPTIINPQQINNNNQEIQQQQQQQQFQQDIDESPNVFYSLFQTLLNRLHSYMPQLADIVINDLNLKPIPTPHGIIKSPFGQIRLNCLELLTVAADFAQFDCGNALAKIPIHFFSGLLKLAFVHKTNNFFLVHFRRLIHLSMIFRRRILKYLFIDENMLIKFINYYNKETTHSDLSAYIVQMLFDFYDHDKLALEKEEQKALKKQQQQQQQQKHTKQVSCGSSIDSFDDDIDDDIDDDDDDDDDDNQLRANFSDEPEDQWSIAKYFDSCDLWQKFKLTVIEEIDAQTAVIADVPDWNMGQSSKLDDLISSLLRTEDEDDIENQEPFRDKINCGLMPSISGVSYYNVLNEYSFKCNDNNDKQRLLSNIDNNCILCYPSFSFAKSQIPSVLLRAHDDDDEHNNDEKDDIPQHFISINLNMNNMDNRERNKLNLVIVLDESDSMGSYWNQYNKMKIDYAIKGIINILNNLNNDDRIGIITFNEDTNIYQQLDLIELIDDNELINNLEKISQRHKINNNKIHNEHSSVMKSGIDFENAFSSTTSLFEKLFEKFKDDDNRYDNRIIFISDYIPQSMSFVNLIRNCSEDINERICTSFISIGGYQYNSLFINHLIRNRGCNYYCPSSPELLLNLTSNKNGKFDEIVTPLIYDLCLNIKPSDKNLKTTNCFNHIYGIKNEKKQKLLIQCGEIYKNYTLFLSHRSKTNGIILIELNNKLLINNSFKIKIEMSFEDRDGRWYEHSENLILNESNNDNNICDDDYFDNIQIRKSILLYRYIKIIKQRIEDDPKINDSNCIESTKWKTKLKKFILYFEKEMKHCNDNQLLNELNILQKLSNFSD